MNGDDRRRIRLFAMSCAVTLVIGTVGTPASAAPGPMPSESADRPRTVATTADLLRLPGMSAGLMDALRNQEALDGFAERVRVHAAAGPSPDAGLSSIVVDPHANSATIYWHGAVPAPVTGLVDTARRSGIQVRFQSAPYTEAALLKEVDRISRLPLSTSALTEASRRVLTVVPNPDGTGLTATIGGLPAGTTATQAHRMVPALTTTHVPVTVRVDTGPTFATRFFDSWPWWGGAYIEGPAACSNAFGVTGLNGAATYMLTAAHCGEGTWHTGTVTFPDGSTLRRTLGPTIPARATGHDGQAIHTPNGAGASVYVGAPINPPNGDPGSNSGMRVGGAGGNTIGDLVCTSGSYTGSVCAIQVVTTGGSWTVDPPVNGVGRVTNMVNARLPGVNVAGNGDSGGPVFAIRTNDNRAIARGVISAVDLGSYERPCTGYIAPGRRCSMSVWYGQVTDIMRTIGVRINTE